MLSALTYLQEEGLSHRNIKPTNILVEASGPGFHFQLTDFALAQPLAITDINKTYYKAPETYVDTYPLTTKQDVWSLFVTLAIACGYLSETELSNRPPSAAAWAVVEAGVQMGELEAMAQQNPTLRASASVMFHQLRPKERVNSRGEVEYPEVSPDYVGLYGSGRLEKDAVIPLGPRADVRTLTGPLGFESGNPTSPLPPATPEPYQYLPSGLGLFDESTSMAIEAPNERMPSPSSHSGSFQQQPDYEHFKFNQYDSVNQRCLASCCNKTNTNTNNSNTPRSLSWTSSSQPLSPYAPSFVPVSPPLAPTTPLPLRAITPTETWDIWGVYKVANTINFSSKGYVRPYPMACDSQEEQVVEDVPLEDYKWTDDDDGPIAINPWQSPLLSLVS